MQKKLFIITFLIIIFGLLFMYPINFILVKKGYLNITNLYVSNTKTTNKLNSIKASIESKSINYLFMYDNVNKIKKSTEAKLNNKLYDLVSLEYYPVGINNDNEYVFRNNEKYIIFNNLNNEELNNRLNDQVKFFNSLDTNINIFIPYRYEYLNINNDNSIRNMALYRTKFLDKLNDNIHVGEFLLDSEVEYNKYFYHTDHHYNMEGALVSYNLIMNLLNKPNYINYEVTKNDINYHGSMAKSSYLTDLSDYFYTADFNLINHDILVDGNINENYKPKTIKESTNPFYDQYVHYYNGLYGMVEYDYHNNKDNLLIIGDSYGWQIDDLIASNYNKTYVIELRYYPDKISLNKFVKEHNISDVLFIYEAGSIFFDQYDYGMKDKVVK
ncbi:MAG: hypothetical protein J5892_03335 [Bacilli bacterium]|nr:hypothetical protein [Bacilli bacterium]